MKRNITVRGALVGILLIMSLGALAMYAVVPLSALLVVAIGEASVAGFAAMQVLWHK